MSERLKDKRLAWERKDTEGTEIHFLVLFNDEINSFNFVIGSLIDICDHSPVQAEQCAMIAHFKGKCEIKKGMRNDLEPMHTSFKKRGLITVID